MTDLREAVTPDIIEIMRVAYEAAISATTPCGRCNGHGFRYGFGEAGHDPDWCEVCGGAGAVSAVPDDRECWQLVLRAIEAAGYAVVPKRLAVTTNPDLLAEARIASLADTPLAKET